MNINIDCIVKYQLRVQKLTKDSNRPNHTTKNKIEPTNKIQNDLVQYL